MEKANWKPSQSLEPRQGPFRLINPEDYSQFGIDPEDVPMGTFAAQDHPGYLLSRYGGNAYGFGLVEQEKLSEADFNFIQGIDYRNRQEITRHAKRLNEIYQKLGLLIRFSKTGHRYFLIPITLIAHSLQDIKSKADEIEKLVTRYCQESRSERLDIGLVRPSHDVLVHELEARLSVHRIFLLETLDKIRSWRVPLDMVIFPQDPTEFLLGQPLPKTSRKIPKKVRLIQYVTYMVGKIHDILEPNGRFVILASSVPPASKDDYVVEFKNDQELKNFLIFTHIFKTKRKYKVSRKRLSIHPIDLCSYLSHHILSGAHLKRLIGSEKTEDIQLEKIDELPYLNIRLPTHYFADPQRRWLQALSIYFETIQLERKSSDYYLNFWRERLSLDKELPESIVIYSGQPRNPEISLESLEEELKDSGLMGCPLSLVASYRNSFDYVLNVLSTLLEIRDKGIPQLSKIECDRVRAPLLESRTRYKGFNAILQLIRQVPKLRRVSECLNPDNIDGTTTAVLENLPKLSLFGFTRFQLQEMLLIVVGHSTMSRIIVGKLPARTLKPITDKANEGNYHEAIELLRACRLMSLAEIMATLGSAFTREQAQELLNLYADAVQIASNPDMDWNELTELRISQLGGIENKALREMLKLFNLFEFLNNWKEYENKGKFEREVLCDYDPEKLRRLNDALNLVSTIKSFKAEVASQDGISYTYFFRHFLETEFHGTGHLFPRLDTYTGFILLWIVVNAAERRIINFNPIFAGILEIRHRQRVEKLREALLKIPKSKLTPQLFEHLKRTLAEGKPAFILETGIRLTVNPTTKAIDVSFVDVEENILQITSLLQHFETHKLRDIALKDLKDMERLFSELESYWEYTEKSELNLQESDSFGAKDQRIEDIKIRLKTVFRSQLFIAEEVFDTINLLNSYCPEILRYVLPGFHSLETLADSLPTRKEQLLSTHVVRCLEKYQALVTKDKDRFQDRSIFYQQAKREFGPYAEEDVGAKHNQLETLEYMAERIQQSASLAKAFILALLFQDIGKFEGITDTSANNFNPAESSALFLQKTGILVEYDPNLQVQDLTIRLIKHCCLITRVLKGEEPIASLDYLCKYDDLRLTDAFVLHDIITTSSVEEGLMTEDLLDLFLTCRSRAHQLIKTKNSWKSLLKERLTEKGQAIVSEFGSSSKLCPVICEIPDSIEKPQEIALERGRRIGSLERLFRLMGVRWVDYQDIQMYLMNLPIKFIYYKRKLKSTGTNTFASEIHRAVEILNAVSILPSHVRDTLFEMLDPFEGGLRIYDFHPVNRFLKVEESLKLILVALDKYQKSFPHSRKHGLISFKPLSQDICGRARVLQDLLESITLSGLFKGQDYEPLICRNRWCLHFEVNRSQYAMRVGFQETIELNQMILTLENIWDHQMLAIKYEELRGELESLPYDTKDYRDKLEKVFSDQCSRITDRLLKDLSKQLQNIKDFRALEKTKLETKKRLYNYCLSEDQEFMLEDIFKYHLERIRKHYLNDIYRQIESITLPEDLIRYWERLKDEMRSFRPFLGKTYEAMVARAIDTRFTALKTC